MILPMLQFQVIQFFGSVEPPPGVAEYNAAAGGFGLITFISNIIRLITVIAGIWTLFNLVIAGMTYISSANDVKGIEKAWQSIYMSLIGLLVIVGSFTITAIVSYIFFGDVNFILNPTITGATP